MPRSTPLYIGQILAWADAWHERTGRWPLVRSGRIPDTLDEKWFNIDMALRIGARGLRPGSSLARLLEEHRGVRNHCHLPPLTVQLILRWADAHFERTGEWPTSDSGPIAGAPGETWRAANQALNLGRRGLPGGSSLAQVLEEHRGVRNRMDLPRLTIKQILAWADAHRDRTGEWPKDRSGPIAGAPGESWQAVEVALRNGHRGLPGGSSLARVLARYRGVRNEKALPHLTEPQILAWADAHHRRTGEWPTTTSGPVRGAAGESWSAVDGALRAGARGLPGGSSLAQLLAAARGVRNRKALPPLTYERIGGWIAQHWRRTGAPPRRTSGPVPEAPGEKWQNIDAALSQGLRGLPGGDSLTRLVQRLGPGTDHGATAVP